MEEIQKGNFLALLVGVNHYDDSTIKNLDLCVNDVKALESTLTKLSYEVYCLHDELGSQDSPTRRNVKIKLSNLCKSLQSNDLLWVHFSCHGALASTTKKPVLILKDTDFQLLDDESEVLSVAQVESYMRSSGARKLILTLDACHSGVNIGRDVSDQEEFFQNVHKQAEGFALLAAATANQVAYEDEKNGIFTYFLLQGLNSQQLKENKNYITVYQLYTYVLNELKKWGIKNNQRQFPTQRFEGLGDIILAYYKADIVQQSLTDDLSSYHNKAIAEDGKLSFTTGAEMSIRLEPSDRNNLINLLINIPDLETERKRRQMLEDAGLGDFTNRIDLSGDTKTVVGQMVTYLSQYGRVNKDQTALGLFLKTVKDITGYEQQVFIDKLVDKYQLMLYRTTSEKSIINLTEKKSLSGQQQEKLRDALIDAFPKKSSLEQLLWFELDKNLDAIAGEGNLQEIAFNLIITATSEGWVEDLIRAARKRNSGNLRLRDIAQELLIND